MQNDPLDRVFGALSDPTRRQMLAQLARGESNVGALAAPHAISQPAISKHLRVLEHAGLIQRTKRGREHHIRVDPRPIERATTWIERYAQLWSEHFDAMDAYLKARVNDARRTKEHDA